MFGKLNEYKKIYEYVLFQCKTFYHRIRFILKCLFFLTSAGDQSGAGLIFVSQISKDMFYSLSPIIPHLVSFYFLLRGRKRTLVKTFERI